MGRPPDTEAVPENSGFNYEREHKTLLTAIHGNRQEDDSKYLVTQQPNPNDARDTPAAGGPANQFFLCSRCAARFRTREAMWEHFDVHGPRPYR